MIHLKCYDAQTGHLDTIHEWPPDTAPSVYENFWAYMVAQDHSTNNVYYITNTDHEQAAVMAAYYSVQLFNPNSDRVHHDDYTSELWLTQDWSCAETLAKRAVLRGVAQRSQVMALIQDPLGNWIENQIIGRFGPWPTVEIVEPEAASG